MGYRTYFGVIAVAATFIAAASTLSAQNNSHCSEGVAKGMRVRTALVTFAFLSHALARAPYLYASVEYDLGNIQPS
jgi:hypothetical protein